MAEPKVIRDIRKVVYDAQIVLAETVLVAAAQDIDDCTGYASATEPTGTGNVTLDAIAARIEHPRNVVITISGGNLTAGTVVVYGKGCQGVQISESFTLTGNGTYTGYKPFVMVDKVNIYGVTGSLGSSDHISIGNGAKIGLLMPEGAVLVDVLKERFNSVDIAVSQSGINRVYGTYIPTSTLDGAKALELYYSFDLPLIW